jgi:hypothetical protein
LFIHYHNFKSTLRYKVKTKKLRISIFQRQTKYIAEYQLIKAKKGNWRRSCDFI